MTQQVQSGSTRSTVSSNQATVMPYAFTTGTLHDPTFGAWNFDTGASSHLNNSVNSLSENFNTCMYPFVSVGDGHSIPVTNTGHSILPTPTRSLYLNNVLITPHIVKNLISVRQFVHDNNCTIEFDVFGFYVKDFLTRRVLLRCDSRGDLYPVTAPSPITHDFLGSHHTWHQRLGHPMLGKHVRLPFVSSGTVISSCFDIIHSDVWTSPIPSLSEGVDVDETLSLVVKPGTIRTVLSLATSQHWPVHQLDVKNAFLHGDLSETVYMHQPPGFRDSTHPEYVCLLQRSLYGLKQAPHAWFQRIASYITREFAMTDLGSLNYFLGISVTRDSSGMFLSQNKYAVEILKRAGMVNCNPNRTPVDTKSKLGTTEDVVFDPTLYRILAGSLQYLTFTRPDISYAVQQVCLHMHGPREPHFSALKRILRYVCGTLDYGLQLFSSSTTNLVAYSDADWAGCPTIRRSTSGYCVFLGNNILSWSAKRQPTLSRSSAEAEYRGVANAVAETCWLRNLLRELHTPLSSATLV
nr:ribonuclease H-like domain-containing protein [Tanacetum cinerariifolium]